MRPSKVLLLLFLAGLSTLALCKDSITLTFFVEHECLIDKDYLEMVVNIKAEDTSLKESLEDAAETVAFVRE